MSGSLGLAECRKTGNATLSAGAKELEALEAAPPGVLLDRRPDPKDAFAKVALPRWLSCSLPAPHT